MRSLNYLISNGVDVEKSLELFGDIKVYNETLVDFFDSAKFPQIKFTMKSFENEGDGEGKIKGDLTIRDVTRPVELDYEFSGTGKNRKGVEIIGFSLEGEIKRSDFNFAPESSTVALGDKIKINIDIEAVKK